jgi:sortase (surface protein transpeptidase)
MNNMNSFNLILIAILALGVLLSIFSIWSNSHQAREQYRRYDEQSRRYDEQSRRYDEQSRRQQDQYVQLHGIKNNQMIPILVNSTYYRYIEVIIAA